MYAKRTPHAHELYDAMNPQSLALIKGDFGVGLMPRNLQRLSEDRHLWDQRDCAALFLFAVKQRSELCWQNGGAVPENAIYSMRLPLQCNFSHNYYCVYAHAHSIGELRTLAEAHSLTLLST